MFLHFLIADLVELKNCHNKNRIAFKKTFWNTIIILTNNTSLLINALSTNSLTVSTLCRILRVDVKVLQDNSLTESRLIVNPRASVAVSARSDLEVERTIDPRINQKQHANKLKVDTQSQSHNNNPHN
jgi:hypothetical protein